MFRELFLLFVFGSIVGTIYEELLTITRNFIRYKKFKFERRCGLLYGPFNPVYGIGAVIFVLCLKSNNIFINFLLGSLIGGVYEFLASFIREKFTGTIGWDYKDEYMNIDGRTTLPFMFFWGLTALLLIYIIYPWFISILTSISLAELESIFMLFWVIIIPDIFITITSLIRTKYRRLGINPQTFLGRFCDKYYGDDKLLEYFPNLTFVD